MKKPNTRVVEFFKSILLVVLFFVTVLLLYFFWESASREPFKFPVPDGIYSVNAEEAPKVSETVIPTEITVGFGNQVYTVITNEKKELWNRALSELKIFGLAASKQSASLLISDNITEETYAKAMTYPSIQFQFQYDIPFQEFCDFYGLEKNQGYEKIEGVSTIAYSEMSKESILFYERKTDKYYAIIADQDYTDFSSMISEIETKGYTSYYPASTLFGKGVENTALLPLSLQSDLLEVKCEKETSQPSNDKVRDLAESFFGVSLDFIRKIIDTKGNVTYMYGYGQKIFNIYADGTFEYKQEASGGSGAQPKFFHSLETALQFVASHGTWNTLDGTDMSAYLKKVVPITKDKRKGYKFIFGMKIGSQNVYFENSTPIIVDVVNNQVTYYRRDMIDFDQDAAANYRSGKPEDTFDPVTVLTENYDYIYLKLKDAGIALSPAEQQEKAFNDIANKITSMEIGYVRQLAEDGSGGMKLRPCYRIAFGRKVTLYFDLFNGAEPIGVDSDESIEGGASTGGGE